LPKYLDFEVSLIGVEPRIWRRFLVKDSATFRHLHEEDPLDDEAPPADNKVRLASHFARKGMKCIYRYDFGDCWDHLVELKAVVELPERFKRRLVGGQRAFPPEDCGGIWGYERCLVAVGALKADGFDETEIEETREWLGDWDPEACDLEAAKKDFDC
jgi:hypothetical protein